MGDGSNPTQNAERAVPTNSNCASHWLGIGSEEMNCSCRYMLTDAASLRSVGPGPSIAETMSKGSKTPFTVH
jgi:hypothetical protein